MITTSDYGGEDSWFSVFRLIFLSEFEWTKKIQHIYQLDPITKGEEDIRYTQTVTEKFD